VTVAKMGRILFFGESKLFWNKQNSKCDDRV